MIGGAMGTDLETLFPCPRCGAEAQLRIGQSAFRGELRWYESLNCQQCGLRTEADGIGFPPAEIREQIISSHGHWKLDLPDVKSIAAVARVLREQFSLRTKEALAVLRARDEQGIYKGTNAEVSWLSSLLEKAGEAPQISRLD